MIQEILNQKIYYRAKYVDLIRSFLGGGIIKVLIGQRRVGKSTILQSVLQTYVSSGKIPQENIYYVNKELPKFDHLKTYKDISSDFENFLQSRVPGMICIAIDEVQQIDQREKFINGYRAQYEQTIEILITGSNSFLLSGDLATYLTGRYIPFHIYPLSYSEYCELNGFEKSPAIFKQYCKYGGLPGLSYLPQDEMILFSYLRSVYETIVFRDILGYNTIKNTQFFKDLYKFIYANIGNIVTSTSINAYLKSQKIALSNDTILNYLLYGEESFVLSKVRSVQPNTKKYFQIYNKRYASDLGMRNAMVGYDYISDRGRLLENYVYLELCRQGFEVLIGRLDSKEIDFVATHGNQTVYIQVTYTLGSPETVERELGSLSQIHDNRPKLIVTHDEEGIIEGIRICKAQDVENVLSEYHTA